MSDGDVRCLLVAGGRVTQRLRRLLDPGQARRCEVLRPPDERVADRPPLPGRSQRAADHAGARGVHGIDVCVRFGCGDLPGAEPEAKHLLGGGHLAPKAWRRLHRVAGRDPDVGHRAGGRRHRQGEDQGGYGGDQGSAPHQGLLPTPRGNPHPGASHGPLTAFLGLRRNRVNPQESGVSAWQPSSQAGEQHQVHSRTRSFS